MRVRLLMVAAVGTALLAAGCSSHARPVAAATTAVPTASASSSATPTPTVPVTPSATTPSPTPSGPGRCLHTQLSVSVVPGQAGVGHVGQVLVLTNRSAVPCVINGYPGLRLLTATGAPMPTKVLRGSGYLYQDPGPHPVTLAPGAAASDGVEWDHIPGPNDPQTGCATSAELQVTPPNDYSSIVITDAIQACNGGQLVVSAMQAGSAGPQ
ncbi:MAG: DUF4232 domain-containing protein [Mycobacteriales bacterium]